MLKKNFLVKNCCYIDEKEQQNAKQKKFRAERVIKKISGKLYAKWKCFDNSFNR